MFISSLCCPYKADLDGYNLAYNFSMQHFSLTFLQKIRCNSRHSTMLTPATCFKIIRHFTWQIAGFVYTKKNSYRSLVYNEVGLARQPRSQAPGCCEKRSFGRTLPISPVPPYVYSEIIMALFMNSFPS